MSLTVQLAPVVLTMTGPVLHDAAVVVEGDTVTDVGPARTSYDGMCAPGSASTPGC